jgi:hypothetical protein
LGRVLEKVSYLNTTKHQNVWAVFNNTVAKKLNWFVTKVENRPDITTKERYPVASK